MKVNSPVLIMVLSMGKINMFTMLHDMDSVDQLMAEHSNSNETLDELHNREHVTLGNNVHEDDEDNQHLGDEEGNTPPPYLTGWEWLTG